MKVIVYLQAILISIECVTGTPIEILPIEDVVVECTLGASYLRGLLAMPDLLLANTTVNACQHLFNCKKVPGVTKPVPVRHNCSDASPTKPYFDINTCECVESDEKCQDNNDPAKTSLCARRVTEADVEENCMNYGPTTGAPVYYLNLFPNLNDPTKFWHCQPFNTTSAIASSKDCPTSNNPNVMWDQRACECSTIEDEFERNELIKFNAHPSNRFRCADVYPNNTMSELCKDNGGQYYTGKVASRELDQNIYYECVQDTVSTHMSVPVGQNCPGGHVFDILGCECNPNKSFDASENFNPKNYKRCATPIGAEEEETCRDEHGQYHIGQIPHKTDCSKFWNCGQNGNPTLQSCQPSLIFNVLTYCGCDYAENTNCAENLRPENKFLCAKNTTSSGWHMD